MIRLIISLIFLLLSLNAKEDINKKIITTSSEINSFAENYSNVDKKMKDTAIAILKQKRKLAQQNKYLEELKKELLEKESSYQANISQLTSLKTYEGKLKIDQSKIEEKLVFLIAQSVSLSVILEAKNTVDIESLIEFEVLNSMLKVSKDKVSQLNDTFFVNSKDISILSEQASSLEAAIMSIDEKQKNVLKIQAENKKALRNLEKAKYSYKRELKSIIEKQNALKNTLAKLNIIKIDEIEKAKEEEERKNAFEQKKVMIDDTLPTVKKHGNSYQSVETKKYVGMKTIAPLDGYTLTKAYGNYTDPIYGIKIFNESISLKPKVNNSMVKTVFNGKVIYADKTAVLNNIVIVEHNNGLHTIYANLAQIAPNIEKGRKIKKGSAVGRVDDELVFEVTQKSYHINPIELFN